MTLSLDLSLHSILLDIFFEGGMEKRSLKKKKLYEHFISILNCTIQWFLLYLQGGTTHHLIPEHTQSPQRKPMPTRSHSSFPLHLLLEIANLLSISRICLFWTFCHMKHTRRGHLCLASFIQRIFMVHPRGLFKTLNQDFIKCKNTSQQKYICHMQGHTGIL